MRDLHSLIKEVYSPIGDYPSLRHPSRVLPLSAPYPHTSYQGAPFRIHVVHLVDPPGGRRAGTLSLPFALRSDAGEANGCGVVLLCHRACGSLSLESETAALCEGGCGESPARHRQFSIKEPRI